MRTISRRSQAFQFMVDRERPTYVDELSFQVRGRTMHMTPSTLRAHCVTPARPVCVHNMPSEGHATHVPSARDDASHSSKYLRMLLPPTQVLSTVAGHLYRLPRYPDLLRVGHCSWC